MAVWWTLAKDDVAKHLTKKMKETQGRGDNAAEQEARREYYNLHGVTFVIVRVDRADQIVSEPPSMILSTEPTQTRTFERVGEAIRQSIELSFILLTDLTRFGDSGHGTIRIAPGKETHHDYSVD